LKGNCDEHHAQELVKPQELVTGFAYDFVVTVAMLSPLGIFS
jgi:hypothetical protein